MRTQHNQFDGFQTIWELAVCCWLAFMLLGGGVSSPTPTMLLLQSSTSAAVILISAWMLRGGFPTKLSALGAGILALALGLVLLQTLPLPFSIWSTLPGRQLFVDSYAAIGLGQTEMPLSLGADATRSMALSMLPAFAGYLSVLTFRQNAYGRLALTIVLCALVGLFIGLVQRSLGEASGLYFYGYKGTKMATGTFGNRNFFAAQLFTSIPFIAALASVLMQRNTLRPWLVAIFALFYMALVVAGLAVIGSRAGIALAILSVFLSILYVFRPPAGGNVSKTRWSLYGVIFAAVIIVQVGMVSIMRFADSDPLDDFRGSISAVTYEATKSFFPFGSGFGTFVPVYQIFERPEVIIDDYVNHAHNDWLELALEGGLPAMILLGVFVVLYGFAVSLVTRMPVSNGHNFYLRAGVVVTFLMLAHALVDFALRTPALMTLFASCCGLIVLATARGTSISSKPSQKPTITPEMRTKKPFTRSSRGFGPSETKA